jgi:hypothetical protein
MCAHYANNVGLKGRKRRTWTLPTITAPNYTQFRGYGGHRRNDSLIKFVAPGQARISQMEREPHTIAVDQLLTLLSVLQLELLVQDRLTANLTDTPKTSASGEPSPEVAW